MTTLVTGGFGFVGHTLVRMLQERGKRVINVDKRFIEEEDGTDLYHYYQSDINDVGRLLDIIYREKVTSIIHTAAISHPVVSRDIPYQTMVTNVLGTTSVFEAARVSGVKRVVNFSSECAYGHNRDLGFVDETAPVKPTTPYGVSKVATEHLARVYTDLYGMEIPTIRPAWVYGPGQFMQCYLKTMLRNAIDGVPTHQPEGQDYRFQYVHAEDIAQAAILASIVPHVGSEVFNITAGFQIGFPEVAERVKRMFPDAEINIGPGTITILDENAEFSIAKAQRILGYQPKYDLQTGMETYAEWLKSHPF
jgi:nucleoside-diphosphate-sugar epimerase